MTMLRPDTCRCEIEISDVEGSRGDFLRQIKRCPIHAARNEDHMAVLVENRRKNSVLTDIMADFPDSAMAWGFDDDRRVVFEFADMLIRRPGQPTIDAVLPTQAQRAQLRGKLAAKYGDRVVLLDTVRARR